MIVDCHIPFMPDENLQWLEEAVASCEACGYRVHVVPGTPHHLGKTRIYGFRMGKSEFVTYCDSDDLLDAGFTSSVDLRNSDVGFWYGQTRVFGWNSGQGPLDDASEKRQHAVRANCGTIYRRAAVEPFLSELLNFPRQCDYYLRARILGVFAAEYLPIIMCHRREHGNNMSRMITEAEELTRFNDAYVQVLSC